MERFHGIKGDVVGTIFTLMFKQKFIRILGVTVQSQNDGWQPKVFEWPNIKINQQIKFGRCWGTTKILKCLVENLEDVGGHLGY